MKRVMGFEGKNRVVKRWMVCEGKDVVVKGRMWL